MYNEVVVPATYSSFLYCGPISNKAGPPPPRRGRDGERGATGREGMGRSQDGWECSLEGQGGENWDRTCPEVDRGAGIMGTMAGVGRGSTG